MESDASREKTHAGERSPTRHGVLTGRYSWRTWLKRYALTGYSPPLIEPSQVTVPSFLRQHGYSTACIGKWHIGLSWTLKAGSNINLDRPLHWPEWFTRKIEHSIDFSKPIVDGPINHGFDHFFGTAGCSTTDPPYVFIENDHAVSIPSVMSTEEMECDLGLMVPGWRQENIDTVFVQKSIEFVRDHQGNKPDEPFFLYLSLSAPHGPHLPPDFVKGRSQAGRRGDMVAWVDWSVGQIMHSLDRLGISENTLLVVTSDNGPLPGTNGHKSASQTLLQPVRPLSRPGYPRMQDKTAITYCRPSYVKGWTSPSEILLCITLFGEHLLFDRDRGS